jgi:RNA polymerase sigma-70 factor (ECF subfamily)
MDQLKAEDRYGVEPFHELTPERAFVRQWALTMLNRVMSRLEEEAASRGKAKLFAQVRTAILGREAAPSYAQVSARTGLSEGMVKVSVHRYRTRYRELLREEIARTLSDPDDIEEEITTLIEALAE